MKTNLDEKTEDTAAMHDDLAASMLENQHLHLFVEAFYHQSSKLIEQIDKKQEGVSTESDPEFADVWRLRNFYELWKENPDDVRLADFFKALTEYRDEADV